MHIDVSSSTPEAFFCGVACLVRWCVRVPIHLHRITGCQQLPGCLDCHAQDKH